MKSKIFLLALFALWFSGCKTNTQPEEKVTITPIFVPPPYVSSDFGTNDYMPLAVGNTWLYWYKLTEKRIEVGGSEQTSIQWLGGRRWNVYSVRKIDDTTEVFTLQVIQYSGRDSSTRYEDVKRSKSLLYGYFARTGVDSTIGGNPLYKKGVGMTLQTWGTNTGGSGWRYSGLYSLELAEYKVK